MCSEVKIPRWDKGWLLNSRLEEVSATMCEMHSLEAKDCKD